MKVRITVQMHLDGVEKYQYGDTDDYAQIIQKDLASDVIVEDVEDLWNPAGPDFTIVLSGLPTTVLEDLESLTSESVDIKVYRVLVRLENDRRYQILDELGEYLFGELTAYLDSINVELIEG